MSPVSDLHRSNRPLTYALAEKINLQIDLASESGDITVSEVIGCLEIIKSEVIARALEEAGN